MNLQHERVYDVHLIAAGVRTPGRLFIRFPSPTQSALVRYIDDQRDLQFDNSAYPRQASHDGFILRYVLHLLTDYLFPALPADAILELNHLVKSESAGSETSLIEVRETIQLNWIDDVQTLAFRYYWSFQGQEFMVEDREDAGFALERVNKEHHQIWHNCSFCKHSREMNYGGDDYRFGLFCFRENPTIAKILHYTPNKDRWWEAAWAQVDAFHLCPAFDAHRAPNAQSGES